MRKILLISYVTGLLSVFNGPGLAQVQVKMDLEKDSILVGAQTWLTLTADFPGDIDVVWPDLRDTIIRKVEILEKTALDSALSKDGKNATIIQRLKITSFDSGFYALPPIRIGYKKPGETQVSWAESQARLLAVYTVPVDTASAEIRDIKGPLRAPLTFRELIPWIFVLVSVVATAVFIYYYLRKRKQAEPVFKLTLRPEKPSYQVALDALEELRNKKLWQSGQIKEYHTELTDILRSYIEARFSVMALEMTTDEIMRGFEKTTVEKENRDTLQNILVLADFVKFAKAHPLPLENENSMTQAIAFVMNTRPQGGPVTGQLDDKVEENQVAELDENVDAFRIAEKNWNENQ